MVSPNGSRVKSSARVVRDRWRAKRGLKRARRVQRIHPSSVRICWDLDNTLVGSGTLLFAGRELHEAVVEAAPLPNMLAFVESMGRSLPNAAHFVLSARPASMRTDTMAWLGKYGLPFTKDEVCLVPDPESKRRIWAQLASTGGLVIVDDLAYGHELDELQQYTGLIAFARQIADVYVGADDIRRIQNRC